MKTTQEFLERAEYLPEFMQDFHDQKLLFKFLGRIVYNAKQESDTGELERMPDWVSAQIYTIDFFLWIMARHGYTLQKSRKHIDDFQNIEETLSDFRKYLDQQVYETIMADNNRLQPISCSRE